MTGAAANSRCRVESELVSETDISLLVPTFEYHGRLFVVSSLVAAILCGESRREKAVYLPSVGTFLLCMKEGICPSFLLWCWSRVTKC